MREIALTICIKSLLVKNQTKISHKRKESRNLKHLGHRQKILLFKFVTAMAQFITALLALAATLLSFFKK